MPTTRDLVADAEQRLRAAGVPSPLVDAELLLAHVTGRSRAMLRLADADVRPDQAGRFEALVQSRAARVPLQHLTGTAPFRHLELKVGPGVFIPRPETEVVVDVALAHLAGGASRLVVDLCSGSGALALAVALEAPGARVLAVESATGAIEWARANVVDHAARLAASRSSVELVHADATTCAAPAGPLADLRGRVDLVVSNPPYIPDGAVPRDPEVRDHDPAVALFGGPDGLDVIRPLAEQAALLLRPGGLLLVEHADVQGEDAGPLGVPDLLRHQRKPVPAAMGVGGATAARARGDGPPPGALAGPGLPAWREVTDHTDLAGRPRFTSAIRAEPVL